MLIASLIASVYALDGMASSHTTSTLTSTLGVWMSLRDVLHYLAGISSYQRVKE